MEKSKSKYIYIQLILKKHCAAKIACMMAVILLNLNLGLQDSLSSEPCVLNLLKIYFARLHALVRICSLLSMPRFSSGFKHLIWALKLTRTRFNAFKHTVMFMKGKFDAYVLMPLATRPHSLLLLTLR